ncbi:hypothetical protein TOPH_02938 [Tolypocladium ophioglossoides CBS 100239]|uniref:Uncharacterized protein n=1 Tax=Tolypocladium ophioglossoides (strain CBS 100239) TaxID=1163406 RepID=A0A0L0NF19_TOLOC|nr:hypothetical protein TOPH_02938 [Tolypocladium ophioglossoides CBS 100239]
MLEFLENEHCSVDLDRIAAKLWWMSKQDSANISPLHRQRVKRRTIVVTEDPKLHLVWIEDRIFAKLLPRYLTSYAFWRNHLGIDGDATTRARTWRVRMAALGYLRTYVYLIRDVSERYAYGEIRLTRLNFYAPLLLGKAHLQRVEYQYGTYFARFYGPILFLIGITSIVLNGLQIGVGLQKASPRPHGDILLNMALWFGVAMILCFCGLLGFLLLLFLYKVAKEWRYAIQDRLRLLEEGRSGGV